MKELVKEGIQELLDETTSETEALREEVSKLRDELLKEIEKNRGGGTEEERAEMEEAYKRQIKERGGFESVESLTENSKAQDVIAG